MSNDRSPLRRDFLRGRATSDVPLSHDADDDLLAWDEPNQSGYLAEYSKTAMACQFEILLNMRQHPQAAQAVADGFQLLDQLETQLTVYRDDSEVSRLNQAAADAGIVAEQQLFELLQLAVRLNADTGGAFDITSSPLTQLWGFDQRAGSIPTVTAIEQTLASVGSAGLQLDPSHRTVQFDHSDLRINLGGIGKGHALDRVAGLFLEQNVPDFIIHGGQSSVLARGNQQAFGSIAEPASNEEPSDGESETETKTNGWAVGLSHPTIPGVRLAEFTLRDQALGTSGTGRQGFFHKGKRYGHIIDPRTGWPTDHILSSTVITHSAALSDALATAFFVMHLDEIEAYCRSHPDVAALLVMPGDKGSKGQIGLEWFNLSDDQWRKLV